MEASSPPSLDLITGPIMVGIIIGVFLHGIATAQGYVYFRSDACVKDRVWLKVLAACVWFLETLLTIFGCSYLYFLTITRFGQYARLGDLPWSVSGFVVIGGMVTFIFESFYAWRVHVISGRWLVSVIAWISSFVKIVLNLTIGILTHKEGTLAQFKAKYPYLIPFLFSLSMAIGILNTCSICYYLHRCRTGIKVTNTLVDQVMVWTIETGLIISVCAVLILILELSKPDSNLWIGIYAFYTRLYSNTLFLSFNGRSLLRECSTSVIQSTINFVQGESIQPVVHVTVDNHSHIDTLERGNLNLNRYQMRQQLLKAENG
ncbi:hypothetical protein C8J56DRAFT_867918 [Mycena floridula]|nr:hypothetical protein C8J56DRAFT_867918 [Mycena floridula]